MTTLNSLNQQFGIAGHLQFIEVDGGLTFAEISNAHATASIAIQGLRFLIAANKFFKFRNDLQENRE